METYFVETFREKHRKISEADSEARPKLARWVGEIYFCSVDTDEKSKENQRKMAESGSEARPKAGWAGKR